MLELLGAVTDRIGLILEEVGTLRALDHSLWLFERLVAVVTCERSLEPFIWLQFHGVLVREWQVEVLLLRLVNSERFAQRFNFLGREILLALVG